MKIQFCPYCGTKLDEGARFCKNCGESVVQAQQSTGSISSHEEPNMETRQPKMEQVKEDPRTKRKTVYDGELHKCPNCGELLKSFTTVCPTCGYEVRSVTTNSPVEALAKKVAVAILFTALNVMSYSWGTKTPSTGQNPSSTNHSSDDNVEQIDWANITLSKVLPEPQSNKMDLLYNGDDWLSVTIHDISENDFLEYVRWCKEDYGFTVNCDSFEDYFYAYNQEGYCLTLCYTKASKELSINLDVPTGNKIEQPEQAERPEPEKEGVPSITKGTEYAYMTDEWNVYIATAISADIIKVENWNKTMSNSKSVSHEYDVGTFKISDSENGFAWVDDEHTTFVLTFTDKNNSKFKRGGTATFTINISDSDKNKGSNYSEDIACFSYQNDDWHLYRAIPLTETLIKIETWYRGSSAGTFLFGYDLCLIDTTSGDTDFEWTDDEHTSFSITMKDAENKYEWKKETFVVFILENEDYTHFDVKSYLGKWEVGEGEVAVPSSAADYKYDNYQDVQKDLENAGFTTITTEILYDIVWGWTEEGEVKSVSIDGRTDYEKGEVFKQDAPIIITYHMKEEDDPNKPTETEPEESKTTTPTPEETEKPTEPDEPESEYEKAYIRDMSNYDLYYMFDTDTKTVVYFGTNDTYIERGTYTGDFSTGVTITWSHGEWTEKFTHKSGSYATLIDGNGWDWEYKVCDVGAAQRILDGLQ